MIFVVVFGLVGLVVLVLGVNFFIVVLGVFNLGFYILVYIFMKRYIIFNIWVGLVVGVVFFLMGWVVCIGFLDLGKFEVLIKCYIFFFNNI